MQDELKATTAIADGVVGVPGGLSEEPVSDPIGDNSSLLANALCGDLTRVPPGRKPNLSPPATGPPEGESLDDRDYWYGLIDEKTAAGFMEMTPRWLQAKRQHGGGPPFIRISARCIRYRRLDLLEWARKRLRNSTADNRPVSD